MPPEKRAPRPSHVVQPGKRVKRAEHTSARAAPDQALRELAALLGKTAKDLPIIRKTDETPPRISIIDVISAITSKTSPILLGFRYGDCSLDTMGLTQFALTSTPLAQGNETPLLQTPKA